MAMTSAVAVPAIALGASSAGASTVPTNFPGDGSGPASCNAWHGAPGGLGFNSPYADNGPLTDNGVGATFGSSSNSFGQEQGVWTGQGNAAAC